MIPRINKEEIEEIRFVLSFKGHQQESEIENFPFWRAKKRYDQYISGIEQITKMFGENISKISNNIPR
jgi:hypothetical protein